MQAGVSIGSIEIRELAAKALLAAAGSISDPELLALVVSVSPLSLQAACVCRALLSGQGRCSAGSRK